MPKHSYSYEVPLWITAARLVDAADFPFAPSLSTPLYGTCAKLAATVCIRLLTLGWTRWSIRYRQRSAAPLGLRRSRTPLTGLSVEIVLAPLRRGFLYALRGGSLHKWAAARVWQHPGASLLSGWFARTDIPTLRLAA